MNPTTRRLSRLLVICFAALLGSCCFHGHGFRHGFHHAVHWHVPCHPCR